MYIYTECLDYSKTKFRALEHKQIAWRVFQRKISIVLDCKLYLLKIRMSTEEMSKYMKKREHVYISGHNF